jgi:tetratricopeptide (TPR) repeat protein
MLTPGFIDEKKDAKPVSGSNSPVYGGLADVLSSVSKTPSNAWFFEKMLSKEREYAKQQIKEHGENARSVTELGDVHFLNKKYGRARDVYLNALKLDDQNSTIYRKLIDCFIALKRFDEAELYFERLIALNPVPQFQLDFFLFKVAISKGDEKTLQNLESEIRKLAAAYPEDSDVQNTLGMYLGAFLNEANQSKQYFLKAIELNQNNFHAINNVGVFYMNTGERRRALEHFRKAIDIAPKYAAGYENIASLYISQSNYEAALDILNQALESKIGLSEIWVHKVGWLLIKLERYQEAARWIIDRIVREGPNDLLTTNLGYCKYMLGDWKEAKREYLRAIKLVETKATKTSYIDQRSLNAFQNLMILADDHEDVELLDDTAKRLLVFIPDQPMALYFRGQAQVRKNNYTFAQELLSKSISIDPGVIEPYINLSFIHEAINQEYEATISLITESPLDTDAHPLLVNNLAYAYIKSGRLAEAKKTLDDTKFKNHPSIYATLGLYYLYLDDVAKSDRLYTKAINNLSDKDKNFATQVWLYEQGHYWYARSKTSLALEKLQECVGLSNVSYAYAHAKELLKKLPKS